MKRLFSVILAVFMIFSLAACFGGEQTGGNEWIDKIVNSEFTTPKNVIILIGDGMGPNDIALAEKYGEGVYDFGLALNQIPHHGLATTHSANNVVTDSAASGTALSTGIKTNNSYIGKDQWGEDIPTMAEIARQAGKKIGIITDEDIYGATPSAFVVHNISRNNHGELTSAMVKFKPDVLMSRNYNGVIPHLDAEAQNIFYNEYVVAKDYGRFQQALDSDPNNEKPFWGFLNGYSTVTSDNLAQCTTIALNRLKNENGFFLMVESSGTDKFGHGNNMQGKLNSVVTLDRTLVEILAFMEENPDTLLVVTSDHETGGVRMPESDDDDIEDLFTSTNHTGVPVRVFCVGKGSEYFAGKTVDNTDIAKFLIDAINATAVEQAPCSHEWQDADCENPKTCTKCGETEGDIIGHIFCGGQCEICGERQVTFGKWVTMYPDEDELVVLSIYFGDGTGTGGFWSNTCVPVDTIPADQLENYSSATRYTYEGVEYVVMTGAGDAIWYEKDYERIVIHLGEPADGWEEQISLRSVTDDQIEITEVIGKFFSVKAGMVFTYAGVA